MEKTGKTVPIVLSILCLSALLVGCLGGGGGGGTAPGQVETDAIMGTLLAFNATAAQRDSAAAERLFSSRIRGAGGATGVLGTIPLWDFGSDLFNSSDDASYTFSILSNGIFQPSSNYAEVLAYYLSPGGTRFDVVFQLVKEEGTWYIDDFRLQTRITGAVAVASYFPLHKGDFWKYSELRNGVLMPYFVVESIGSEPETIGGKKVYTIRESFEPRPTVVASVPPQQEKGRYTPIGGVRRFSNDGGLWDFGCPEGGPYVFNGGRPFLLASPTSFVGSYTLDGSTVAEVFRGSTFQSTWLGFLSEKPEFQTAFGTLPVLGLNFSLTYSGGTAPTGPSTVVRSNVLREGLGILVYKEFEGSSGSVVLEQSLVEARVAGKSFNPADLPFRILSSSFLPDAFLGTSFSATLDAQWGFAPIRWSLVSGSLPPGISLAEGGVVSGVPTVAGQFGFTLRAQEDRGKTDTRSFSLIIGGGLGLSDPSTLPSACVGESYSHSFAVNGGTAPFEWAVISQSPLPPGMTFDKGLGRISGTPVQSGEYQFQVQVAAKIGGGKAFKTFFLKVRPRVSGTIRFRKARIEAYDETRDTEVTVTFKDEWDQPIAPDAESLGTASFSLLDILAPKGPGQVRTVKANPTKVLFDGIQVRLTFAKGTLDLRSTTKFLTAKDVLSADLTRTIASEAFPIGNQWLLRKFVPWSDFSFGAASRTVPVRMGGVEGTDGYDLVFQFPDALLSTLATPGHSMSGAGWTVATESLRSWGEFLGPGEFRGFCPQVNDNAWWVMGLKKVGSDSWIFIDQGMQHAQYLLSAVTDSSFVLFNSSKFWFQDAMGLWWLNFLVADGTSLNTVGTVMDSNVLDVRSSFPTRITDCKIAWSVADPAVVPITVVDDQGRFREFSLDDQKRLTGGGIVAGIPDVSGEGQIFRFSWWGKTGTYVVTDSARNRIIGMDEGKVVWTLGGDTSTSGYQGRFNRPFDLVDFAGTDTNNNWYIISDRDGIQVFEAIP